MTDDEVRSRVHYGDPFAVAPDEREHGRQLRGRLAAPVTVWTAGRAGQYAGLTVSSIMVADGEPAEITGLVGALSDLYEQITETRTFSVHFLDDSDRRLADSFAGAYPVPPFEGVEVTDGPWGPVLAGERTIASCRYVASITIGYYELVRGAIEQVHLSERARPLVHYRGHYGGLRPL